MKQKVAAILTSVLVCSSAATPQSGGGYDLSHAVVAGGGGHASGGQFTLDGTSGQSAAGSVSGGGLFNLRAGFWAFEQLSPTSSTVSISGRVISKGGQPIAGTVLRLYGTSGPQRMALSSTFGHFRFDGVPVGESYVLEIRSGRYGFHDPVRVLDVTDDINDIEFVAASN